MSTISSTSSSATSSLATSRITGLTSGMDTESMVKDMMATEQAKLDRIYQNKTKSEWKKTAYNDVISQLKTFREKYMSVTSADNIYTVASYKAYSVDLTANSYVGVTANSQAAASSHVITSANIATSATLSGTKYRSRAAGLEGTAGTNLTAAATGTKTLAAGSGSVALNALKYTDDSSVFTFNGTEDKLSFSVNGETFIFDQTETLDNVMTAVNAGTTANATMSLGSDGLISIKSDVTGSSTALKLNNITGFNSVFGTTGAFGIAEGTIAQTSLISTDMTLDAIATATGKDFGFDGSGNLSFSINGESFTFNKTQTMDDVITAVNANATSNVKMTYNESSDQFVVRSLTTGTGSTVTLANTTGTFFGADSPTALAAGTSSAIDAIDASTDSIRQAAEKMGIDLTLDASGNFTFAVNGKNFSFNASSTSVSKMISTVNSDATANVTMSYSQITDSFVFKSDNMGAASAITLANADSNAFGAGGFFGISSLTAAGTDATMVIDGETITQSSNSFTLDGMTFDLKASFDSTAVGSTQSSLSYTVDQDVEGVVTKVKAFITAFNEVISSLNEKIAEKVDYDYTMLTEAQRDELSDDEEADWDKKAKVGLLRNDSTINALLTDMRTAIFKTVGDTGLSASDIGLSTGSWYNNGKIELDEDVLRTALKDNSDVVSQVFVGSTTSTDKATIEKESGLITRFFSSLSSAQSTLRTGALQDATDAISDYDDAYDDMVDKMADKEEKYYAKFTTMETLLSQYSAQSSWLSQTMSSL